MPRQRVGIPPLLELRPLAWSLLKGQMADRFSLEMYPCDRIPDLLRAGDLELGFVSAVELLRSPELQRVRDLGVAFLPGSPGLALRLRRPLDAVRVVEECQAAQWAIDLARVVLRETLPAASWIGPADSRYGRDADAELLCGAPALASQVDTVSVATLWHRRTSAPLPLGGWAAAPRVDVESCEFALKSSLRYGLSSLDAVAREAAAECGLQRAELESYYRNGLSFVLDDAHRAGLEGLQRALDGPRHRPRRRHTPPAAAGPSRTVELLASAPGAER